MLDNVLIEAFLPIIQQGLIADGFTGVSVKQANQPTQQGVNSNATVYFYKVSDHRYGWVGRSDVWDGSSMVHTELQKYETVWNIAALVTQDPNNISYTAADLVNEVAAILQSDSAITALFESDIQILRISDISNIYFTDDRDLFEAHPTFDFTLTHSQTRVSAGQVINLPVMVQLYPV
jgi:hypothetical protein